MTDFTESPEYIEARNEARRKLEFVIWVDSSGTGLDKYQANKALDTFAKAIDKRARRDATKAENDRIAGIMKYCGVKAETRVGIDIYKAIELGESDESGQ